MKTVLLTAAFFAVAGLAQDLSALGNLPPCGQTCIKNMLALAPSLGCQSTDVNCLCKNARFGYGIRDCTNESCPADVRASVISAGTAICTSAAAGGSSATAVTSPTGTATGGAGGSSGSGSEGSGGSKTPVTTEAVVTTITSGHGPVTSTIGSTTLFSVIGGGAVGSGKSSAGSGASSATGAAGSAGSSGASGASSAASGAKSAASSATGAAASGASSAASGASSAASAAGSSASKAAGGSSSSSGLAPAATMMAQSVLGAAGLAAVLLL